MTMLDYAYWITQALLAAGVLCSIYRVYKGPSVLDRVISVDVILIIVGSVMLVDMIYYRHTDHILFVVVSAVIGFLGAVAIARYVAVRQPDAEDSERHAQAIGGGLTPEPETPASASDQAAANSGRSAAGQLEDESTSWFADLARSGFVPKRRNGDDEGPEQGSGGGERA